MPYYFGNDIIQHMNSWDIKREAFPNQGSLTDKIKFVLGYAILAPSTHNSQPWLFKIEGSICKIYYDKELKIPEADPISRDLYISMGCMIENIAISANYFGIFKDLKYVLQDNFIAEVYFQESGEGNKDLEYLINAIPKRVNARGIFEPTPLSGSIQAETMSLKKDGRINPHYITDRDTIKNLSALTGFGLRFAYKSPSFRKEMSGWMHNSLTNKKTGLPGYSLRMPLLLSFIIPTLVRFFDISPLLAKLNYKSMSSAPFIFVLTSAESSPSIWLEVGRLAERYMLHLNSQDIKTSIFVASIEMGDIYKKVQGVLGTSLTPQFIFCAGYMKNVQPHSPRENLESKLI